jgi:prepilin-type N-terminal cleavage/methylation domain-containing protein
MKNHSQVNRRGFSLLELIIVVAIAIILTAIAVPVFTRTAAVYQLNSSGTAVASMLEMARLRAVKSNQPYYAIYNNGGCQNNVVCAVPATEYSPTGSTNTSADPTVMISGSVVFQDITQVANAPHHHQLDNYLGGNSVVIEPPGTIGFNARGLPCVANATSPFICQLDPNGVPAFEWFMQSTTTQDWVAITVSPAGRIRSWRVVATGAQAQATCGHLTCWE